jgi:hypothetical protein
MASATLAASARGKSTSAPEEKGMPGLKLLSGVTDTVIEAYDKLPSLPNSKIEKMGVISHVPCSWTYGREPEFTERSMTYRIKRAAQWAAMGAALILVSSCANLTSIGRSTKLPQEGDKGVAIHLDAKQRMAFAKNLGIVCAEPSPDAFTALASGFGLGLTTPQQASISLANALAESGGSIGLRTQSITLMRDALYRVCEAYYNNALNSTMVMELLQRYQNVMTAILAIEQLTGAVTAPALAAAKQANASASASLNDLQRQLEEALENEKTRKDAATKAEQTVKERRTAHTTAKEELEKLQSANPAPTPEKLKEAKELVEQRRQELEQAETDEKHAKLVAQLATEVRENIAKARQASITNATAAAGGTTQFGPSTTLVRLSDASTQHIATAVQQIVTKAFDKDYTKDACLNFLASEMRYRERLAEIATITNPEKKSMALQQLPPESSRAEVQSTHDVCIKLIDRYLAKQQNP